MTPPTWWSWWRACFVTVLGVIIGAALALLTGCLTTPYQSAPKPRVTLTVSPAVAFAGVPLEVRIHVSAHPSNRGVMVQVDGGPDFFSISSFDLIPDVPTTRVLHFPRPRGLDPDGLIVTTATVIGPLGPIASADKTAYRRRE